MKKELFWKNFNLGTELAISGNFIYNGLKAFDELESFYYEDEIFEFFYYISVGIERLEKIAIILIEHDSIDDQECFEKSLISHNHLELMERVKKKYSNLKLSNIHNSFIQLLGNFYKTMRYDRYSLKEPQLYDKEKKALLDFITRRLTIKCEENTENTFRIKKFIGKIVGKIATEFYEVIVKETKRLNIYLHEQRPSSKACKIFVKKEFDFLNENVLWKELLIFLMKNKEQEKIIQFINKIEPLEFDSAMIPEYLEIFHNDLKKQEHVDELEELYNDVKDKKNRLEMLDIIGDPNSLFDFEPDEDCN